MIEETVFIKLFSIFGDKASIEDAIKNSSERSGEYEILEKEEKVLKKENYVSCFFQVRVLKDKELEYI